MYTQPHNTVSHQTTLYVCILSHITQ